MIFEGMTATTCSSKCNADGCVISGRGYCAHPRKGGLQAVDLSSPDALRRAQQARDQITQAELSARMEAQKVA
jgi:hypothetical protein